MIQFCNHMAGSVLVYYFLIDERELVFQFLHFDRLLRLGSLTGANDLNVLWNYITFEDCHHEKSYRTRDLTKLRQHSLTWGVLWYNIVVINGAMNGIQSSKMFTSHFLRGTLSKYKLYCICWLCFRLKYIIY